MSPEIPKSTESPVLGESLDVALLSRQTGSSCPSVSSQRCPGRHHALQLSCLLLNSSCFLKIIYSYMPCRKFRSCKWRKTKDDTTLHIPAPRDGCWAQAGVWPFRTFLYPPHVCELYTRTVFKFVREWRCCQCTHGCDQLTNKITLDELVALPGT